MAEIILSLRNREICRKPILHTEFRIGRDLAADLVIDNAGVSHAHAVIRFDGTRFIVVDTGSQNGITLNGRSVQEGALSDGDTIGVHKFALQFRADGGVPVESLQPPRRVRRRPPRDVMRTIQFDTQGADTSDGAADAGPRSGGGRTGGWWAGALVGLSLGVLATLIYFLILAG